MFNCDPSYARNISQYWQFIRFFAPFFCFTYPKFISSFFPRRPSPFHSFSFSLTHTNIRIHSSFILPTLPREASHVQSGFAIRKGPCSSQDPHLSPPRQVAASARLCDVTVALYNTLGFICKCIFPCVQVLTAMLIWTWAVFHSVLIAKFNLSGQQ